MDSLSAFFVILMVVLGGVSAYVADILGYKIGKKRLSLWHIRPKYIARTAVVIAGALIPLITIILLYMASANFRKWLTEGQKAIEQSKQITRDLEAQEKATNAAENKYRVILARLNERQKDLEKQDKNLQEQDKKLKALDASLKDLNSKIRDNLASLKDTRSKLTVAHASLKTAQSKLSIAQTELKKAQDDVKNEQERYAKVKGEYNTISSKNLELTSKNLELGNKNQDLDTANKELQKNLVALQESVGSLSKEVDALKLDKSMAEKDAQTARDELQKIQDALVEIRLSNVENTNNIQVYFRNSKLEFGIGEEVARIAIPANLNEADALTAYRTILRKAKAVATDRGAKPDKEAPFTGPAGFVVARNAKEGLNDDELERYWVTKLTGIKEQAVFVARVKSNRFVGDAVPLAGTVYANPIAFRKGEIVAEYLIDSRLSDNEIRSQIREFLQTFVNTKARSRRMIPVVNRFGESFGEVTEGQFYDTFARIKTVSRQVRLVALARFDTRVGDPLYIDLELH